MERASGGEWKKTNRLAIRPNPHSDPLIGISSVDHHSVGQTVNNRVYLFGGFMERPSLIVT
jgi:hypothetical protein